jgi:Uncharacterized protein conserved in bacteria (DUF2188)
LAGVGETDSGFFLPITNLLQGNGTRGRHVRRSIRCSYKRTYAIMLGRHVYRVLAAGKTWLVTKEGEAEPRASHAERVAAIAIACRLGESDQPARITIDNGDGTIAEERLFGADPGDGS